MKLLISSLLLFIFYFCNVNILDNSIKPKKSDLIVSLGGDVNLNRVEKASYLFKHKFSTQNIILLTGYNEIHKYINIKNQLKRKLYLNENNIFDENIKYGYNTKNTYSELKYLKQFMLSNKYHSAIVVSDPPHSRRISILIKILHFKENDLHINIVSSEPQWWEHSLTKANISAVQFVISEDFKIVHNIFKYGFKNIF